MLLFSHEIREEYLEKIEVYRKTLPVDVKKIAEELEINIIGKELSQAGYIQDDDNEITIYVNKDHPEPRQRFTIAHEIAHFLVHREALKEEGTLDRDDSPLRIYTDKKESEANALAADILMPIEAIDSLLKELYSKKEAVTIEGLADRLQVSEQALKIKLSIR